MGFLERMLGNLMRGGFGGHHGGYRGGHHGGSKHGGYGAYPGYPQDSSPGGGNLCPKCSSANARDARFCRQCGASLAAAKCSGCGAELPAGAQFCGQCGKARQ